LVSRVLQFLVNHSFNLDVRYVTWMDDRHVEGFLTSQNNTQIMGVQPSLRVLLWMVLPRRTETKDAT